MKNYSSFCFKALLFIALMAFTSNSFSQNKKFPAQFHYSFKTGRFQKGNDVTLTFLLTNIKTVGDYQALYATFSKEDLLKKVVMSPFDQANGSALCSFTFLTPKDSPFKPNYLQKVLVSLGVTEVYFDNDIVETKDIVSYMLTKEKQAQTESGK